MPLDATKALDIARDAYDASTNYFDSSIRTQIESDIMQWQGRHAADSKYLSAQYRGRSRLFRPKTRSAVSRSEAIAAEALFSTLDVVNVSPRDDSDDLSLASSQVMQQLLQYRLTTPDAGIPWFLVAMGAYQDAQVAGVALSYHYWQYDQMRNIDRPWVELLPVENFRFDPAASWLDVVNTTPYCIRMVPMYVKDVMARMTVPDPITMQPRWKKVEASQLLSLTKQQWDSTRLARQGKGRTDQMDNPKSINEYSIVWCHQNVIEWNGRDYLYWTGGTEFVLSDPTPLQDSFAHGRRPFVMGFSSIETHKPYPSGPVRQSKDVQAEINDLANARIDNVKFVLSKRYFVRRGRMVDLRSLMSNVPGSATMMTDPEKDVIPQDFNDVTASSYQEQDRLNLDFDDVSGTFSGSSVASNRKLNETVGGMNILTTNGNQLGAYRLRTFVETWLEPALRQIMMLEQEYESDMTVLALAGKKAKLFQRFGVTQITDEMLRAGLTLTVNVGMGATNPQDKINNLALALRNLIEMLSAPVLLQNGLKADELIKEVMGAVGYKDGGRFFDMDSDDPRVDALLKIIEDLTNQLNLKHPPELIAAQVEEAHARVKNLTAGAVKTGVEAAYSAMQAGEVVMSAPMVAPIADMVMKSAGFQPSQPAGVDPNIVPGAPEPTFAGMAERQEAPQLPAPGGSAVDPLNAAPNPRTNTSPAQPPVPASPMGARSGIETQRFDGGSGESGESGESGNPTFPTSPTIPPLQSKPDALNYQPRWFREHEGARTAAQQQKEEQAARAGAKQKADEDERKFKEPKLEDVVTKALMAALKPVITQIDRLEGEIRRVQDEVRAIDIPEPQAPVPAAAPVINVEPHIHIDKGGNARVMEIKAPSGETYKGKIEDEE